VTLLGRGGSH